MNFVNKIKYYIASACCRFSKARTLSAACRAAKSSIILLLFLLLLPFGEMNAQPERAVYKTIKLESDIVNGPKGFPDIPEQRVREPKIALVLSGGGAKGLAHIGVLNVLRKHNIPIHAIYGTSIGAVVGGLYAIGYTPSELSSILRAVDISSMFSIAKDVKREYLYQDQKLSFSKSFFTLRFKDFKPVIPSSISSGQELTNLINQLVLQGIYHTEDFTTLPIKFYPVSTDLVSGKSVTITKGNLSEAIRGSFTWPLLNPPVTNGSMKLIDGGILANIPAHFPAIDGYDLIISVNTTSGLRKRNEINTPWEIIDQILSVMQAEFDQRELKSSDITITPSLHQYNSTSFADADSIIAAGEAAGNEYLFQIAGKIDSLNKISQSEESYYISEVNFEGSHIPYKLEQNIINIQRNRSIPESSIIESLKILKKEGFYKDVSCEIRNGAAGYSLLYKLVSYPYINSVKITGDSLISKEWIASLFSTVVNKPFNHTLWAGILDSIGRKYRSMNLSLANVYNTYLDSSDNSLHVRISEGVINKILIQGNENTKDYVILREFPMQPGDIFNIDRATRGLRNISSTDLFESVILDVNYKNDVSNILIKVTEKPAELMRLGIRVDNEKQSQIYVDFRDENLFDGAAEYGISFQGGFKNLNTTLDMKTNKIFKTPFYVKGKFKYQFDDQNTYRSVETNKANRWNRKEYGEFREEKIGPSITVGGMYKKLGFLYGEYKYEIQRISSLSGEGYPTGKEKISSLKAGLIFDSQDVYPFPTKGILLNAYYEFASAAILSKTPFTKSFISYEAFLTPSKRSTFHPKVLFGFGDNSLPYTEQFKLGGQNSFFGMKDNEYRGRQIFTASLEYRWLIPSKIFFDTYLSFRYDLGSSWEKTEAIKLENLKHALGVSFMIDTPIGPAQLSVGNAFTFNNSLSDNPISFGPVVAYFSLGYTLD